MKVSAEQFKKIRKKYEENIYKLMDDIDPSGFNADTYRIAFFLFSDNSEEWYFPVEGYSWTETYILIQRNTFHWNRLLFT